MNRHGEPMQLADDDEVRAWLNAALACEPPVSDAVPGVRAAIRRRRHRMATSIGVALVAVAGLVIGGLQLPGAGTGRLETLRPATSSPAPSVQPSPSPSPASSSAAPTPASPPPPPPSASPSAARVAIPHLTVAITTTSAPGARDVTWSVRVRGLVPQLWNAQTGMAIPPGYDHLLGTVEIFGDGSPDSGSDGGAVRCHRGAPLVPVDRTFRSLQHTYAKPGDYTFTFGARACVLGTVTQTVRVHVTGPAQQLSLALPSAPLAATVGQPVKVTLHTTGMDVWPYVVDYGDGAR